MPDPPKRRDFLGLTALWGVAVAMGTALAGVMRLPKPAVQPGPLRVFKLGDPAQFAVGSTTRIETGGFFLFHGNQGFHTPSPLSAPIWVAWWRIPKAKGSRARATDRVSPPMDQ